MLRIDEYDDDEYLACPCYLKWFNLLKKKVEPGFYNHHYYNSEGITLCGMRLIGLSYYDISDPNYPDKQDENCEECLDIIEKQGLIERIPVGKTHNKLFNKIIWKKRND